MHDSRVAAKPQNVRHRPMKARENQKAGVGRSSHQRQCHRSSSMIFICLLYYTRARNYLDGSIAAVGIRPASAEISRKRRRIGGRGQRSRRGVWGSLNSLCCNWRKELRWRGSSPGTISASLVFSHASRMVPSVGHGCLHQHLPTGTCENHGQVTRACLATSSDLSFDDDLKVSCNSYLYNSFQAASCRFIVVDPQAPPDS